MSYIEVSGLRRRIQEARDRLTSAAAEVIEAEVRKMQETAVALVPRRTGKLAELLASDEAIERTVAQGAATWRFGFLSERAKREGWYWRFVEMGTRGYEAGSVRQAGIDKYGRQRQRRVKRSVPARRAQPFMGPALVLFKQAMADRGVKAFLAGVRGAGRRP
jgi:HK97 gp10 family phage protein